MESILSISLIVLLMTNLNDGVGADHSEWNEVPHPILLHFALPFHRELVGQDFILLQLGQNLKKII
jgi:hypothetical protein